MREVEHCPICRCENLQILRTYEFELPERVEYDTSTGTVSYVYERLWMLLHVYHMDSPAKFEVTICTSCGLVFTNPRFSVGEIRIKYDTMSELGHDKKRHLAQPPLKINERANRIYSLTNRFQEKEVRSRRVLDYGGAEGYNCIPFIETYSCYLLDYIKYDSLNGIKYLGTDASVLQTDQVFDVILLSHVLEHTSEPVSPLESLLPHLAEDGLLYVEVPLGCFAEWEQLWEPITHVNFFSEESLFKCLDRVGLSIIYLSTAYQWVTHSKMWCVNVVACKKKGHAVSRFMTTREQMNNPYYRLRPLIEYYVLRLEKRLRNIFGKMLYFRQLLDKSSNA